ncbi:MAG: hypothetical protein ABI925_05745 [Verrucomicrobiota bacterium]
MILRPTILLMSAALISSTGFTQEQKPATVGELVAQNVKAKGGPEALRALKAVRLTGKMLVSQGQLELGYVQIRKKPDAVRDEISLQGMTQIAACDGKEAWRIAPFRGRKDPEKMSADDVKELVEEAEIDGPLVDWQTKGSTVEYLGKEDVDGTMAYKLKVVRKNGNVSFVYLDPDHFLEIRILTQRMKHGAQVEEETDLSDYEKINGVFIPFSIESGAKGDTDKQKVVIEKAEGNGSVDDSLFHFPGPAK